MMYYYNDSLGFFPFNFMGVFFMIFFWGFIIYGFLHFFRGEHVSHKHHHRSIDTLKDRYAKGEISKEQFDSMKKDLE